MVSLIWEVLLLYRDVSDLGGVVAADVSLIWEVLLLQICLWSGRCCCCRMSLIWEVLLLQSVSDLGGVVATEVSLIWEVLLQMCLWSGRRHCYSGVSNLDGVVATEMSDLRGVVATEVSLIGEVLLLQRCLLSESCFCCRGASEVLGVVVVLRCLWLSRICCRVVMSMTCEVLLLRRWCLWHVRYCCWCSGVCDMRGTVAVCWVLASLRFRVLLPCAGVSEIRDIVALLWCLWHERCCCCNGGVSNTLVEVVAAVLYLWHARCCCCSGGVSDMSSVVALTCKVISLTYQLWELW